MSDQTVKDLRGTSREYKRHHDKSHKWGNGVSWGPGRLPTHHPRPAKGPRYSPGLNYYPPPSDPKTARSRDLHADYSETLTDNLVLSPFPDEEITIPAGFGGVADADVAYSFDAPNGPSSGSMILGVAVSKAVERFENKATDKLVKDEYLVLDEEGEPMMVAAGRANKKNAGKKTVAKASPETSDLELDEEYEFV